MPEKQRVPWTVSESQEVLDKNNVRLEWSDEFTDGMRTYHCPEMGSWAFYWKHGVISLDGIDEDESGKAILMAGMIVHLWLSGITMQDCDLIAKACVEYWDVYEGERGKTFEGGCS